MSYSSVNHPFLQGEPQLRSEELSYNYYYRTLSDEAASLAAQLENLSEKQARERDDLRFHLDQQYCNYQAAAELQVRNLRAELASFAERSSFASNGSIEFQLSRVREETHLLRNELEKTHAEREYWQNKDKALSERGHPREDSLRQMSATLEDEIYEGDRRGTFERRHLEEQACEQDRALATLNREISEVSVQLRENEEKHYLVIRDLRRQLHDLSNDVEYFELANRELSSEKQETVSQGAQYSEHTAGIETELSRLKEINAQLKPKAKKLENLVYGKGISPKKNSTAPHKKKKLTKSHSKVSKEA